MSLASEKNRWLHITKLVVGSIIIVLTILFLVFINGELQTVIPIITVTLILTGIMHFLMSIFQRYKEGYVKYIKFFSGIFSMPAAILLIVLADTNTFTTKTAILLFVALIFSGMSIISSIRYGVAKDFSDGLKLLVIILNNVLAFASIALVIFTTELIRAYYYLISCQALLFIGSGILMVYPSLKLLTAKVKQIEVE